mgnify:CR=1 FL=1
MKTTIIQLETHDDLISIRDKIEWCKSQRIILVFPKVVKRLPNVLELRLIERSAVAKGAQIALVTRDHLLCENAGEAGIPVFRSIPLAQKGYWSESNVKKESRSAPKGIHAILDERDLLEEIEIRHDLHPVTRVVFFLLALAALFSMVAFILPSAQITVYPVAEMQSVTLEVSASPQVDSVSITGTIPASEHSFSLTLEKTASSSGTTALGQSKASGEFLVNNLTQSDLILPEGTIFSVNGDTPVRFILLTEVDLPAGGNGAVAEVEALMPGEEGNIAAGTTAQVEGIFGTMIDAASADEFSHGSSSMLPAPTDEDYEKLSRKMLEELTESAAEYLEQMESETQKAILETLRVDEILSEKRVNPVGEPSDSLTLDLNVQFHALVYDPRDIVELMTMILDSNLQKGFHSIGNVITIENLGSINTTSDVLSEWQVKGTRPVVKNWGNDRITALIKGKKIDEGLSILDSEIPHTKPAVISPTPKFWPRFPCLPNQIHIVEIIIQ